VTRALGICHLPPPSGGRHKRKPTVLPRRSSGANVSDPWAGARGSGDANSPQAHGVRAVSKISRLWLPLGRSVKKQKTDASTPVTPITIGGASDPEHVPQKTK
jgi:hypothetical protein